MSILAEYISIEHFFYKECEIRVFKYSWTKELGTEILFPEYPRPMLYTSAGKCWYKAENLGGYSTFMEMNLPPLSLLIEVWHKNNLGLTLQEFLEQTNQD